MSTFEKIKNFFLDIWHWFLDLSMTWRILGSTLSSGLIGSNIVAISSEYATYFYCLYLGIRPPVEGIPYLKTTIGFTSFALTLVAVLLFLLVFKVLQKFEESRKLWHQKKVDIANRMEALNDKNANPTVEDLLKVEYQKNRMEKESNNRLSLFMNILIGVIIFSVGIIALNVMNVFDKALLSFLAVMLGVFSVLLFMSSIVIERIAGDDLNEEPFAIITISFSSVAILYAIVIVSLYITPVQRAILKVTNYGGFTDIVLIEIQPDKTTKTHSCQLVLRSTTHLTCFYPSYERFVEYPIENIQRVSYKAEIN